MTEEGGDGSVMATAMATATSIAVAPLAAEGIVEIPMEEEVINMPSSKIRYCISKLTITGKK